MAKKRFSVGFLYPGKGYRTERVWAHLSIGAREIVRQMTKGVKIKIVRVKQLKS